MDKINPPPKKWGNIQVHRDKYFTKDYLDISRFLGLQAQLAAVMDSNPKEPLLEIGPGPGLFSGIIHQLGFNVTTFDIDPLLLPDVAGRLPELPFKNNAFYSVCAFEILEHIPFELFGSCLREIKRVASKRIIISVPDQRKLHRGEISVSFKIFNHSYKKTFFRKKLNSLGNFEEHYWEIGFNGISPKTIIEIAEEVYLEPLKTYFRDPWYRFFEFKISKN